MIPNLDARALSLQHIKLLLLLLDPHLAVNRPKAAPARGVSATLSQQDPKYHPTVMAVPGRLSQGGGTTRGLFAPPGLDSCPWLQLGQAEAPAIQASLKCSNSIQQTRFVLGIS